LRLRMAVTRALGHAAQTYLPGTAKQREELLSIRAQPAENDRESR